MNRRPVRPVRPVLPAERGGRAAVVIVVVICGMVLGLCVGCRWAGGVPLDSGNTVKDTAYGPLSEPALQLIKKVQLANLWEQPMAEEASTRAQSEKVRQISKTISYQHKFVLEPRTRAVAKQLGISLPTRPSAQQQAWIADMQGKTGAAYDLTYVKWLRFAHGQIFGLIGQVRGTSYNSVVRSFADDANKFVMMHMQLLESTGLTKPDSFPPPPKYY